MVVDDINDERIMVVDHINDEQSQAKSFDNTLQDLPAVCASVYHQILIHQGGTYNRSVGAII